MNRNRLRPTIFLALGAVFVLASTSSCGEKEALHPAKPSRPRILLLLNVNTNEFFRKIEEGFRQGMSPQMKRDYDLDVRYCLKPSDVAYQRMVLDRCLADYVEGRSEPTLKAVIMTPAGSKDEVTSEIKQLRDHNIPVVLVDLPIKPAALARAHTDYSAFIGSQNRDGAILAADEMARCLPEGGSILVLNGPPGMEVAKDRKQGFTERMAEISKQGQTPFKTSSKTADFLRSQARIEVDELLTGGQNFDGIFAANDEMALGALEALHQRHVQNKVVVIGFDAIQEALKAVKDGRMAATIAQDPAGMGLRAAQTVENIIQNKPFNREQILPPKVVTNQPDGGEHTEGRK